MSDFRAIATVTKTLESVLQAAASQAVPGALVRTARPEAAQGGGTPPPGIDLYLYQVTPNGAFRGDDLPTRRSDGTLVQRPRAAVDLHYLLVFRGNELELEPQRLLGNSVRALHGTALLGRPLVHAVESDPANPFLAGSDLADAPEVVKITPLPLTLEELSKIWSVFFQIPYNLSLAYQATVVVIEGDETPTRALPVLDRRLYVTPMPGSFVAEAVSADGGPLLAGRTLVLRGHGLKRPVTRVSLRGVQVEPQSVRDTEVRVPLTVPPFPASALRAGVQGVAVVHPVSMGMPEVEHTGFESNAAPLVLCPRVTSVAAGAGAVTVDVDPPVRQGQRALLLMNAVGGSGSFQFSRELAPSDLSSLPFDAPGVPAGVYLLRVQVDGADSPLVLDPARPDFGPVVTVGQ